MTSPTYKKCIQSASSFSISFTTNVTITDLEKDLGVSFTKGESTLTTSCNTKGTTLTCDGNPAISDITVYGNYTTLTFTTTQEKKNTYTYDDQIVCYDIACPGTQTEASQSIDFDTKTTFTVVLSSAYTGDTVPTVLAGTTSMTCKGNDVKTTLTCTPTKDQLTNGSYDIYLGTCKYYAGVTLTVTGNASGFINISKLFIVVALFLF